MSRRSTPRRTGPRRSAVRINYPSQRRPAAGAHLHFWEKTPAAPDPGPAPALTVDELKARMDALRARWDKEERH
jgi:hypothetical protein